jgi:GH15 family glucan-1,4-alpha-glucosidase
MIKKAILKSFNATTYKATVQIIGSLSVWLENVPVSRAIPSAEMVAGRICALVLFDLSNPSDCLITAVY